MAADAQVIPSATWDAKVPPEFVTQRFTSGTAFVRVPPDWERKSMDDPRTVGFSWQTRGAFGLTIDDASGMTLKDAMADGTQQIRDLANGSRHAVLTRADYVQLPAGLAGRIEHDQTAVDGVRMKNIQIMLMHGTTFYLLTLAAPTDEYDSLLPIFKQIASSFSAP